MSVTSWPTLISIGLRRRREVVIAQGGSRHQRRLPPLRDWLSVVIQERNLQISVPGQSNRFVSSGGMTNSSVGLKSELNRPSAAP